VQHTATLCNTQQHTATPCNTLQHTATAFCNAPTNSATHRNTLQHTAAHCNRPQHTVCCSGNILRCISTQYVAVCCNLLQCVAMFSSVSLWRLTDTLCAAMRCSVLQCVAVCCIVLQCVVESASLNAQTLPYSRMHACTQSNS